MSKSSEEKRDATKKEKLMFGAYLTGKGKKSYWRERQP